MGTHGTIVVSDDDESTRELLRRMLTAAGYDVATGSTFAEAAALVEAAQPDLLLLDIRLPDGDGRNLVRRLRGAASTAGLPVILMTAHAESARLALLTGADAILQKPFRREDLLSWVRVLVRARRAEAGDARLEALLVTLAATVEARSGYQTEHIRRVRQHGERLATAAGLGAADVAAVRTAALIHDIGMIAVPETVLALPRSLSPQEFARVKPHAALGAEICGALPEGSRVAAMVRAHHERWHGGGYPDGLRGQAIPVGARIIAIADAFDALTSPRPYREAQTPSAAIDTLWSGAGAQWDPDLVERFAGLVVSSRNGAAPSQAHPPEVSQGETAPDASDAFLRHLVLTPERP